MIKQIDSLEDFKNLKVGDKIYWKNEERGYTIKARSERYIIVVKMMFGKPYYSILDLEQCICSTNNYVFNPYDYCKQDDIEQSLMDLVNGEYELSRRNEVYILQVIDRYKIA